MMLCGCIWQYKAFPLAPLLLEAAGSRSFVFPIALESSTQGERLCPPDRPYQHSRLMQLVTEIKCNPPAMFAAPVTTPQEGVLVC